MPLAGRPASLRSAVSIGTVNSVDHPSASGIFCESISNADA